MGNLFYYVKGSNMDGSKTDKQEIIEEIIEELKLNKEETVMIGDRKFDIIGAKKCKVDSIGVLYGYGTRDEINREKPEFTALNPNEIYKIIKG